MCAVRGFVRRGVVRKFGGTTHFLLTKLRYQAVLCTHKCLYLSYRAHIGWISGFYGQNMSIYEKIKRHMSVCNLRTRSCSHYEHFHVYLTNRRQTGNVVTHQTFDRAPRLTRPPTAHISRGDHAT